MQRSGHEEDPFAQFLNAIDMTVYGHLQVISAAQRQRARSVGSVAKSLPSPKQDRARALAPIFAAKSD